MDFDSRRADAAWVREWLTGRALARGLPLPFFDQGGWRAEIGSDSEQRRWVFAGLTSELRLLAETLTDPALKLRALATPEAMRAHLPAGWIVGAPSFAMTGPVPTETRLSLPRDYRLELQESATSAHAFVLHASGELAASGHGGRSAEAFVYDRIVTQPEHRRRGLARAVMAALGSACRDAVPGLLVATEEGRPLYETLGWRVVSPYASASWTGDSPVQN